MKILILGAGYVGLVSAACFAEFGVEVVCVDHDEARIERLCKGEIPIYEPGLDVLVRNNFAAGRLRFLSELPKGLCGAQVVFIAVGTPARRGDGHADLSYVMQAAQTIAGCLKNYAVIVTKSTVPVGTGRKLIEIFRAAQLPAGFDVCSNPEFLREGSAINDFMRPDRVIIGCESDRAAEVMRELYRPLYLNETPIVMTNLETAELTKYAANAFLATKITFINEIADLCEKVGADVQLVAKGMGLDGRIGRKFLHAGPGYGGSCFPKDTLALVRTAASVGNPLALVETVVASNEARKKSMYKRVVAAMGGNVVGKKIAILGLTFKPNTDDMRESVSLDLIPALQEAGAFCRAYDPVGVAEAQKYLPQLECSSDAYEAAAGADAAVIITEWNEFRALDLVRLKGLMRQPVIIDMRNIYKPEDMVKAGFIYSSIGRGAA